MFAGMSFGELQAYRYEEAWARVRVCWSPACG